MERRRLSLCRPNSISGAYLASLTKVWNFTLRCPYCQCVRLNRVTLHFSTNYEDFRNTESEDSIAVYFPETNKPDDRRTFLALFDGHNGRAMSDFLCDHLLGYVANALSRLPQQYHNDNVMFDLDRQDDDLDSEDIIATTIKQCFKDVDDAMLDVADVLASPSKTNAVRTLRHAYSGSCALMSVYDVDTKLLRVALTGDSRAVLGRKIVRSGSESQLSSDTTKTYYTVHPLSFDQNAYNPSEVTRLQAEHPGEKVVENGRIMGWGISRAFGNGQMKWSLDIQKQLYEKYLGRTVRSYMKTPPYLTGEWSILLLFRVFFSL